MTADRHDHFESPLAARYASREMTRIFSARFRLRTWRRLWLALAESERELGLPIEESQLEELRAHLDDVDFDRQAHHEKALRHDVMAQVHSWREQCPNAGRIIHLGATSCFVTDNSELVQQRDGLDLLLRKLRVVIRQLAEFAEKWAGLPTVGYTHFQTAQFTTVGKRAGLWLQDLLEDHEELSHVRNRLRFRGVKGTTGSQDSFLKLFDGDADKVARLDDLVTARMGFDAAWPLTGQTYPRKQDSAVLNALSGLAQSAGKMSSDLRLLANLKEVEEPFEKNQIGSSAMAYKRNPMRSERLAALARWLISLSANAPHTAATQWLERTLDDSANRRLSLGEGFLTADAILELLMNVTRGLVVNEAVIRRHTEQEMPFIASEEILMAAVKRGGDRQELHEVIRTESLAAATAVKEEGVPNPLLERIAEHPELGPALEELRPHLEPARFVGRAREQVLAFVSEVVQPLLSRFGEETFEDGVRV